MNPVEKDHRISFQTCNCYVAPNTGPIVFRESSALSSIIGNSNSAKYRITYNELIVLSNAAMKQETTVESFINDNYKSYKDNRIKYYHTDTVKEPMDSYKPIRYNQYSLLISRIVTVRALNAYQCPDSCMFLFEMFEGNDDDFGSFFSMLYTGDFCYNNKMKDYCKSIISIIPSLTLLHVDDTACLLNKGIFSGIPYSREDAISTIHYLISRMKRGSVLDSRLFQR